MSFLIYGANGYTGELTAREAVRRGQRPILAGRNAAVIEKLASELNCEARVFDLDAPKLDGVKALVEYMVMDVRARDLKVIPLCPFTKATLEKHPEWQDILKDPF